MKNWLSSILNLIDLQDKELKKYCNSLRCPFCNCQLDGNIKSAYARLYCCQNNEHYRCEVNNTGIVYQKLVHYFTQYKYVFHYYTEPALTTINRINTDNHPAYQKEEFITRFNGRTPKFFFNIIDKEETFLEKLKLYLVFK